MSNLNADNGKSQRNIKTNLRTKTQRILVGREVLSILVTVIVGYIFYEFAVCLLIGELLQSRKAIFQLFALHILK